MNSILQPISSLKQQPGVPGVPSAKRARATTQTIVFVHGIRSSHETFEALAGKLRAKGIGAKFQFAYFDYSYRQSIAESGRQLAKALKENLSDLKTEVTIVGHSMGGLVGRLALLQQRHEMPFVKRLIMLGTPNHGTLHTGKLGLLMQLTREVTGKIWSLTTKKTGVKELTEIDKLLNVHLNEETQKRTYSVEYVSIPATCFHEGAGLIELMGLGASRGIGLAPLAMELFKALPGWSVGLEKPHDGIVEESSVYLGNRGSVTRRSERRATCNKVPNCGSYVHVCHDDFRQESHVTIQTADRTAAILAELFKSRTIAEWRSSNAGACDFVFEP